MERQFSSAWLIGSHCVFGQLASSCRCSQHEDLVNEHQRRPVRTFVTAVPRYSLSVPLKAYPHSSFLKPARAGDSTEIMKAHQKQQTVAAD